MSRTDDYAKVDLDAVRFKEIQSGLCKGPKRPPEIPIIIINNSSTESNSLSFPSVRMYPGRRHDILSSRGARIGA